MATRRAAAKGGVNRFVVDLGGVQLPEEVARQLEIDIRRAALSAVATLDFGGDLRVGTLSVDVLRELGATRGIIIRPPVEQF